VSSEPAAGVVVFGGFARCSVAAFEDQVAAVVAADAMSGQDSYHNDDKLVVVVAAVSGDNPGVEGDVGGSISDRKCVLVTGQQPQQHYHAAAVAAAAAAIVAAVAAARRTVYQHSYHHEQLAHDWHLRMMMWDDADADADDDFDEEGVTSSSCLVPPCSMCRPPRMPRHHSECKRY